jgi:hypothetical protein
VQLHGKKDDHILADHEFQQVKLQTEADQAEVDRYGQWQLFTEPAYRNRLFIGVGLVAFVQSCGFLVIFSRWHSLLLRELQMANRNLSRRLRCHLVHIPWP